MAIQRPIFRKKRVDAWNKYLKSRRPISLLNVVSKMCFLHSSMRTKLVSCQTGIRDITLYLYMTLYTTYLSYRNIMSIYTNILLKKMKIKNDESYNFWNNKLKVMSTFFGHVKLCKLSSDLCLNILWMKSV